jgi:hypothetical protein
LQAKAARQTTAGGREGIEEVLGFIEACRREGVAKTASDPKYQDPETPQFAVSVAFNELMHAQTWDERRAILSATPALLEPAFLAQLDRARETDPRTAGVRPWFVAIVTRAREVGVDRACQEFEAAEEGRPSRQVADANGPREEPASRAGGETPEERFRRAYDALRASVLVHSESRVEMHRGKMQDATAQFEALAAELRAGHPGAESPLETWEILGRSMFWVAVCYSAGSLVEAAERAYRMTCHDLRPREKRDNRTLPAVTSYRLLSALALEWLSMHSEPRREDLDRYAGDALTDIRSRGLDHVAQATQDAFVHIARIVKTGHTDIGSMLAAQLLGGLIRWEESDESGDFAMAIDTWAKVWANHYLELGLMRNAVGVLRLRFSHALRCAKQDTRHLAGCVESATTLAGLVRAEEPESAKQFAGVALNIIPQVLRQLPAEHDLARICVAAREQLRSHGFE